MTSGDVILFDAGLFIAALLSGDPRHAEAYPLVEAARRGTFGVFSRPPNTGDWPGVRIAIDLWGHCDWYFAINRCSE